MIQIKKAPKQVYRVLTAVCFTPDRKGGEFGTAKRIQPRQVDTKILKHITKEFWKRKPEGDSKVSVPRYLPWWESLGREENVGFDLVRCYLCPSSVKGGTVEGVGLRMANSYTGNHRGDDFTPLETIRRFLDSIIPSDCPELLPKDNREIDFRNFMYVEDDEELSFLHRELSLLVENTTDSRRSPPREEMLVVGSRSVAERMKSRKCITKGSTNPPMKCRLVQAGSSSSVTRQKTSLSKADSTFLIVSDEEGGLSDILELQNATACHLKISNITPQAWRGHLDNQVDAELLNFHDRCYVRQVVMDNAVNRKAQELLKAGYQENLTTLKSKVASLEAEKAKLEVTKASLRQEVKTVKCDRMDVVSKVEPYVAMELVQSDEMGRLASKLVSSVVFYGRCVAFEEVADMKEPFDLTKVKGYRPSCKKEHTKAGNDLGTATFPFLSEAIANPFAPIEALLSKKP
ncbi:hypothetical protein Tco_0622241 [Tanacetum coccineum]